MKRRKGLCKNKPHQWNSVTRPTVLWPFEVEKYRICLRCGKKNKGVSLS